MSDSPSSEKLTREERRERLRAKAREKEYERQQAALRLQKLRLRAKVDRREREKRDEEMAALREAIGRAPDGRALSSGLTVTATYYGALEMMSPCVPVQPIHLLTSYERGWFHAERSSPHHGHWYRVNESLFEGFSKYQNIVVAHTEKHGRVLLLDGLTQVAERSEFQYHEVMTHPALICHPRPANVLILGAGDGGVAREVLRHCVPRDGGESQESGGDSDATGDGARRSVAERVQVCELDSSVVSVSRVLLPSLSNGAFDSPNVHVRIGDARAFVQQSTEQFDVIISDMTDPFGPSAMLYTREFFGECRAKLEPTNGMFVMHGESPLVRPSAFQQIWRTLGEVFEYRWVFYVFIEAYASLFSVIVCSTGNADALNVDAATIDERLRARSIDPESLRVYRGETHHSLQVEMAFLRDIRLAAASVPPITDAAPHFLDEARIRANDRPLQLTTVDTAAFPVPQSPSEGPPVAKTVASEAAAATQPSTSETAAAARPHQ